MGDKLTEIAIMLIGVATIALLINRSGDTARVIQAGTTGFDRLLRTVSLQNGMGIGGMTGGGYFGM